VALQSLAAWGSDASAAVNSIVAIADSAASDNLRYESLVTLAEIGDASCVPTLQRLLSAEDPHLVGNACAALGRIGEAAKGAVGALRTTLSHENAFVRRLAAEALGRIGAQAKAALPALRASGADDADERVRRKAIVAVKRIEEAVAEAERLAALAEQTPEDEDEDEVE
jgi:HEAT repeat protein